MKRLVIFIIILTCFSMLSHAQLRGRVTTLQVIQLNEPNQSGLLSFETVLARQRSTGPIARQTLRTSHLGQLAWAGAGIDRARATSILPNQVFPLQLYLATSDGLFLYRPVPHQLEETLDQDIRGDLAATTTLPAPVAGAGCDFIIAGSARSMAPMPLSEGREFLLVEAGRAAQNIQMQALSMNLSYTAVGQFESKNASKICRLSRDMDVFFIVSVGAGPVIPEVTQTPQAASKRAVLIAPAVNFQDEEFFETIKALELEGIRYVTASTRRGVIRGVLGNVAEAGLLVTQINLAEYDAVIFIGGAGVADIISDPVVLNLTREAVRLNKIVAASSTAVIILANADVIKGVRITGLAAELPTFQRLGGIYTGLPVEQDRRIITSAGPATAVLFGRTLVNAIIAR
jgi:putative intracellular protease/amidase